jgi:serine/threonine-protein kinase RsbW
MPTIDVSFTALAAHVRTARLIALAVARRTGVEDELLDEIRLAVGEACSRAVGVHATHAPDTPVTMRLSDDRDCFSVEVIDAGPLDDAPDSAALDSSAIAAAMASDDVADIAPAGFGLVVISGLVDDVVVTNDGSRTHVTMSWPAKSTDTG